MTGKSSQQMSCMEVWGGSQLTERGVEFGGLWVYSKPFGHASHGGDVYYASSCATGRITHTTRKPSYSVKEKLQALLRFSGSLIRAVDPRAERPPLPDFNLANIGGAIIPALGRRWRRQL